MGIRSAKLIFSIACEEPIAAMARPRKDDSTPTRVGRVLSTPRVFLARIFVTLMLTGFLVSILSPQLSTAFKTNPFLNSMIIGVFVIGSFYVFWQVMRLYPEIRWVNAFRIADPGLVSERQPMLAGADVDDAAGADRDAVAIDHGDAVDHGFDRLPPRRGARHRQICGRPAGVPRPAGHVLGSARDDAGGRPDDRLAGHQGRRERHRVRASSRKASPRRCAAWARRSRRRCSVLSGSLVLGFLELQATQAHNRFYNELEEWLSGITELTPASDGSGDQQLGRQIYAAVFEMQRSVSRADRAAGGDRAAGSAAGSDPSVKDLAQGVNQLVTQMRKEQTIVRAVGRRAGGAADRGGERAEGARRQRGGQAGAAELSDGAPRTHSGVWRVLAGLCRRAVDPAAGRHLPALAVHALTVST